MRKILDYMIPTIMIILIGFGFIYVGTQVSATSTEKIKVISGNGKNFGDEVAIGDEHFYIISNNGYKVRMLAKYNLDVDMMCKVPLPALSKEKLGATDIVSFCPQGTEKRNGTGLQKDGIGVPKEDESARFIGVPYASQDQVNQYMSRYGNYNDSKLYNMSTVKVYVDKYVRSLKDKYGINIVGTIPNDDDVVYISRKFEQIYYDNRENIHDMDEMEIRNIYKTILKFLDTYYWTEQVYNINSTPDNNGDYSINMYAMFDFDRVKIHFDDISGVRPVIEVEADEIDYPVKTTCKDDICFTDNDSDGKISLSDEICIGKECFYVLNSDKNQVKLLSMFNLDVGYKCELRYVASPHLSLEKSKENLGLVMNDNNCSIIPSTYKQSYKTLTNISKIAPYGYGSYDEDDVLYGTVEYANDAQYGKVPSSYNGSLAQQYVVKYVEYLKSICNKDISGTLLRLSDLEDIFDDSIINISNTIKSSAKNQKYSSIFKQNDELLFRENPYYNALAPILINDIPDWIFNTNYWTRTSYDSEEVYGSLMYGLALPLAVDFYRAFGIRPLITIPTEIVETGSTTIAACYTCGDELIWTNAPGSSCKLNSDIKTQGMCINNPKTGIRKIVIISLIVASIMVLGYVLYRRHNRFEGV